MATRDMRHGDRGFTLIEVLVYSSIVTSLVVATILSAHQIIEYSDRLRQQLELGENQRFLVQKLNWVLGSIQAVNTPAAGATSTILSVNKIGFGQNPLVIDLVGGTVRLALGGGVPVALTNNFASVTNLTFERVDFTGQSAIRIRANLANNAATTSLDSLVFFN